MKKMRMGVMLMTLLLLLANLTMTATASGPVLAGGVGLQTPATDLTFEGTLDWGHWGQNLPTDYDQNATVPPQIAYAFLGTPWAFSGYGITHFWSNGTPTPAMATDSGLVMNNIGDSFMLRFPADPLHRTARIYVNVCGQGELTAYLTDGSAPVYIDTPTATNVNLIYKLHYAAANPNQFLVVEWKVLTNMCSFNNAGISLQSATLSW